MAKAPAAPANAPAKSGGKGMLVVIIVCGVLAVGAGVAGPMFLLPMLNGHESTKGAETKPKLSGKSAYVPFGDVVVNLNEDRLTRYLRIKLLLVVDTVYEKEIIELVAKHKPILKNWLIGYLSDKSLQDVTGAAGVNRLRREIGTEFNNELFPDGSEQIQDIIFEEFVVQ